MQYVKMVIENHNGWRLLSQIGGVFFIKEPSEMEVRNIFSEYNLEYPPSKKDSWVLVESRITK